MKNNLLLTFAIIFSISLFAQDTTTVQTFEFSDITKRRGWYEFPPEGTSWEKIIMEYTIKCDAATTQDNFACGEWDYTTFTNVYNYTGILDSNILTHPLYVVNGAAPTEFEYHQTQVFDTQQSWDQDVQVNSVMNEVTYSVNDGIEPLSTVLATSDNSRTSQFIIHASELTVAGMVAGDIGKMSIDIEAIGADISELIINLGQTTNSTFSEDFMDLSMTNVHDGPFSAVLGENEIQFIESFTWDGTSNILIEMQFETGTTGMDHILRGTDTGAEDLIYQNGENGYYQFTQGTYIDVPAEAFANVTDEVTVSCWVLGDPDIMPTNSYAFEGVNENNNRLLNVHLPWSNGQVYWDAGYNGGYDRINAQASTSNYEGQWNHWAFTKDAVAGEMKIYLNGNLWLQGTDKFRSMAGITKFRIGSSQNPINTNYYEGAIDEFRVWNKALDQVTIAEYMNGTVPAAHPNINDLQLYYTFNNDLGTTVADNSMGGFEGTQYGLPNFVSSTSEYAFDLEFSTVKPNVTFYSGDYNVTVVPQLVEEIIAVTPITIQDHSDTTLLPAVTTVIFGWDREYGYTYDPDGAIIDSTLYGAFSSLFNEDLSYWGAAFEIVETVQLGNFVTPYGIGLSLGANGWTYWTDVSDYILYLRDSVDIRAHNNQELLDLKFHFIEGTPPREVISSQIIWTGDWSLASISQNTNLPERDIQLNPLASQYKIKTRATGHGFGSGLNCSEFCPTTHFIRINGLTQFTWENWKECADNPIIDQGGTWIYDRAGWCPGTFADTYEFDITPFVDQGQVNAIDYGIQQVSIPDGNQRVAFQLFEYGPFNFQNDAEIADIVSPSNEDNYSKINPVCGNAKVVLRNRGSNTLTSANIYYKIQGGPELFYFWTGSLDFDETEIVTLPINDVTWWGASNTFVARVDSPNTVQDENENNDTNKSQFVGTPMYPQNLEIRFRTNNFPNENEWRLYDEVGNLVESKDFTTANFTYKDTIQLMPGCYRLFIEDSGDDGLSFFANNDGTGYVRIRDVDASNTIVTFEPNFGKFVEHQFTVGYSIGMEEVSDNAYIYVYPNPAKDILNIEMDSFNGDDFVIELFGSTGKMVRSSAFANTYDEITHQLYIEDLASGIYYLRVRNGSQLKTKKIIIE